MKKFPFLGGGVFLLLAGVTVFNGCSVVNQESGGTAVPAETPFASLETLDAITNSGDEYIYWKVSRVFAMMELQSFKEANGWNGAELSEYPILVYDSGGIPKYYEFRVSVSGREVGAVTANVRKADGGPVTHVLNFSPDYGVTRNPEHFLIIDNSYPHVAYASVSKQTGSLVRVVDENGDEISISETGNESLLDLDWVALSNFGITDQAQLDEYIEAVATAKAEYDSRMVGFWSNTALVQAEILSLSDEEIEEMMAASRTERGDYTEEHTIPIFVPVQTVKFSGACGTTTVGWIGAGYWGIDSKSCPAFSAMEKSIANGKERWQYFITNNQTFVTTVLSDVGSANARTMCWGVELVTGGRYKSAIVPAVSTDIWAWVKRNIDTYGMPVISSRMWHFRAIFGYKHTHQEVVTKFWFITYVKNYDKYYFLVHDNGYDAAPYGCGDTGTFWELSIPDTCAHFFFNVYRS